MRSAAYMHYISCCSAAVQKNMKQNTAWLASPFVWAKLSCRKFSAAEEDTFTLLRYEMELTLLELS